MEQRIHLRPITVEDTTKIVEWRNKDFVRRNFIYQEPFTEEGHLKWVRERVETGNVVQFIICLPNGREIGSVYFRDIDKKKGTAEYGIFIGEENAIGCGYGTETAKRALEYAFTTLELNRVFLRFLADNIGAWKSYAHAGFRMTGQKEMVETQQGKREVCFMEIDRDMWNNMQTERTNGR